MQGRDKTSKNARTYPKKKQCRTRYAVCANGGIIMNHPPLTERYTYVNIRELVEGVSKKYADRVAYSFRRSPKDTEIVKVTYPQLAEDVRRLSTAAVDKGLTNGKVALVGKLSYDWIVTYLALLSVGTVLVPLDSNWSAEELADTARVAECQTLFCSSELKKDKSELICSTAGIDTVFHLDKQDGKNTVSALISYGKELRDNGKRYYETARISPDELSLLVFTSGTTGKGKGVMLSQTAIVRNICSGLEYLKVYKKTVGLLPPHHTFGSTVSILGNLVKGSEMYISSGVRYVIKELKEQHPEHLVLVPLYLESFYKKIMDTVKSSGKEKAFKYLLAASNRARRAGIDLRRKLFASIHASFGGELRLVVCGGAPVSQELIDFFDQIGITVLNGYGITECSPLISVNPNVGGENGTKGGSCGKAIPTAKVKIKDPDENGEGEICVKGTGVMLGYYKDPEATEAAFDEDGYFRTGDCGRIGSDGRIFITGRLKNLIILSNGKNVYPEEIELMLAAIPGVCEVVVYEGISPRGSEHNAVVAEIYPDMTYLEAIGITDAYEYFDARLKDYNRTAIAYKKVGKLKVRYDEFPKNTLKKIVRFKIDRSID